MYRTSDIIRTLAAPLLVFGLLYFAVQLGLDRWTDDPALIDSEVIGRMNESAVAIPGDTYIDEAAPAEDPLTVQLDALQQRLFDDLLTWARWALAAGLGIAWLWSGYALWKQQRTVGPKGQASAWFPWVLCAVAYVGLLALAYFSAVRPLGLDSIMAPSSYWTAISVIALLGLVALLAATILAASPVMKPSVPFGTRSPV